MCSTRAERKIHMKIQLVDDECLCRFRKRRLIRVRCIWTGREESCAQYGVCKLSSFLGPKRSVFPRSKVRPRAPPRVQTWRPSLRGLRS